MLFCLTDYYQSDKHKTVHFEFGDGIKQHLFFFFVNKTLVDIQYYECKIEKYKSDKMVINPCG